jgi:hypothetical protein
MVLDSAENPKFLPKVIDDCADTSRHQPTELKSVWVQGG